MPLPSFVTILLALTFAFRVIAFTVELEIVFEPLISPCILFDITFAFRVIAFTVELEIRFEPCIVPYISELTTLLALTFAFTVTNEGLSPVPTPRAVAAAEADVAPVPPRAIGISPILTLLAFNWLIPLPSFVTTLLALTFAFTVTNEG